MSAHRRAERDFAGHRMVLSEGKVTKQHLEPMLARHLIPYEYSASLVKGKDVLEIGCGTGYGSSILAEHAKSVTAIDISEAAINIAKESYIKDNLRFAVGDAGNLSAFKDGSYDIVFSSQCIEHVIVYEKFVSEVSRILKKGGTFVVITPNAETYITGLNPFHHKEFTKSELNLLLARYFKEAEVYGIFGNEKVMEWLNRHYRLANLLISLGAVKLKKVIPDRFYTYMFQKMTAIVESSLSFRKREEVAVTTSDFRIDAKGVEKSIDLLGICKK